MSVTILCFSNSGFCNLEVMVRICYYILVSRLQYVYSISFALLMEILDQLFCQVYFKFMDIGLLRSVLAEY